MKHIIGHRNPDTDTICSAIVYQDFLTKKGVESKAYALGELNNETRFIFEYFNIEKPERIDTLPHGSEIILLDHNESGQSISNIDDLDIVEIIDHHKIKLETDKPISIYIEPLGSSCSIIAKKYFENNVDLSKEHASLLLSGIISDTLYFRSPTTTEIDKDLANKLNKIAKIDDLEKYSLDMFNAKSDLGDISINELINLDYKTFEFGTKKYGVGVMETTNKDFGVNKKNEILKELLDIKINNNLDGVFFTIIDILNEKSYTLYSGDIEKELFTKLFNAEDQDGVLFVDNLVSRKKQIIPVLKKGVENG